MRKLTALTLAAVLLAGCHSHSRPTTASSPARLPAGSTTGGADARAAVLGFLNAAKNQDLQALSGYWGTAEGAARTNGVIPRDEMERRELIMLCYLDHQSHTILTDAPGTAGERVLVAELRNGALTRSAKFNAVRASDGRWYVKTFDMEALQDLCKDKSRPSP
ncbi:MAG TPA: hypothetical protein VJU87_02180 [Gemmatimonadaceae bacterium]|nr:hypothetical protein [Gemmatimonadaceae bacterium]